MATASGWKREDAVVSEATRRLQKWISCGLWSAREADDGAPVLAHALSELLGARAVLLMVHSPTGTWQPVALAAALAATPPEAGSGSGAGNASGRVSVTMFPASVDASMLDASTLHTAREALVDASGEPLMRDSWSPIQAALAAESAAVSRATLDAALDAAGAASAQPATPAALSSGLSSGATSGAEEASSAPASTWAGSQQAGSAVGSALGLDSSAVAMDSGAVSDWVSSGAIWGEAPSLLLPLLAPSEEESDGGACGAALAWIESEDGRLSDEWLPLWSACGSQAGAWLNGALRLERVGRSYRDLAHLAARIVDARDPLRAGHGPLVAHACVMIARALGLGEAEVEEWEVAGLLHGVGRVPLPDSLLQKQGALDPDEREAIRASMQQGAQWLDEVEGWGSVAQMVRHAGESWDGSGYPDALEGESIPLGARAIAIASRFASLSQSRAERGALGSLRSIGAALESEAGRALDPQLTALFLASLRGGSRG